VGGTGRKGKAFLDLWHPDGLLNTPMVGRTVKGNELDRLLEAQIAAGPDFVWQLLDWTSRGDVVIVEWQTTRFINGSRFSWRGVDKFRVRDGKVAEERDDTRRYVRYVPGRYSSRSPGYKSGQAEIC
jgi:hypothetical protein